MTFCGLDEWFWAIFKSNQTWPNFTFGQFFMWIGESNNQICCSTGYTSDSEQCLNRLFMWLGANNDQIIMSSYIYARWVTLNNVQIVSKLTYFTFGQLLMWIWANNDQKWLPMGWMSDSEQCSNRLALDLASLLVNFSCELEQIMTRYDFLWARRVILSNVQTNLNLT